MPDRPCQNRPQNRPIRRLAADRPAGPQTGDIKLTKDEIARVEKFLRKTLQSPTISVRVRPRKTDSAEVYVGEEFIGVVYEDDEDDEKSFNFQMAILAEDLAG